MVASILFSLTGFYIYLKNRNSQTNIAFGLLWFCIALWLFGYAIIFSTPDPKEAYFWTKFVYLGVIFIPTVFYHITVALLDIKTQKTFLKGCYWLSALFLIVSTFTDWFVKGLYQHRWGFYAKAGFFQTIFLFFFALVYGRGLFNLYRACRIKQHAGLDQARIRFVFWAFVIAVVGAIDFIPTYGVEFYPFGYMLVGTLLASISYAIIKHRLLDITTVIHKTILWLVMSCGVTLPVVGLFYLARPWLMNLSVLPFALVAGALALFLIPYVRFIQPCIDHLFQRRKYDLQKVLQDFIHEVEVLK
ncbi:MAG: hypothetical protein HYS08_06775, partial [Chlamydiae bacterium]|nr:hypothetical protein [Chlamydiota bacterium]